MNTKLRRFNFSAFYVAFCVIMNLKPYFIWGLLDSVIITLLNIICFVVLILHNNITHNINKLLLFLLFIIICLYTSFISQGNLYKYVYVILIAFVPFLKPSFIISSYKYFIKLYTILLSISLFIWILLLCGFSLSYNIIPPLNPLKNYNYRVYPLLVVPNNLFMSIRFHGIFDEPGVVGTICLILLFIEDFHLKKWYNIILLVTGISSFSLVFYIGSLLYIILKLIYFRSFKKCFLLIGILFLFVKATINIPIFDEFVYKRMQWDKMENKLTGDNRSSPEQKKYLSSIRGTSAYFFGDYEGSVGNRFAGSSGYRDIILSYGVLFSIAYCLFFFLLAKNNKLSVKNKIFFFTMFISVLFQRPAVIHMSYIFLFLSYMVFHSYNKQYIAE